MNHITGLKVIQKDIPAIGRRRDSAARHHAGTRKHSQRLFRIAAVLFHIGIDQPCIARKAVARRVGPERYLDRGRYHQKVAFTRLGHQLRPVDSLEEASNGIDPRGAAMMTSLASEASIKVNIVA